MKNRNCANHVQKYELWSVLLENMKNLYLLTHSMVVWFQFMQFYVIHLSPSDADHHNAGRPNGTLFWCLYTCKWQSNMAEYQLFNKISLDLTMITINLITEFDTAHQFQCGHFSIPSSMNDRVIGAPEKKMVSQKNQT